MLGAVLALRKKGEATGFLPGSLQDAGKEHGRASFHCSSAAGRVVARDIGGNFGTKNSFFPEFAMVVWGARRVGRPVKWTAERHEAFITDYMGRDLTVSA